MPQIEVADSGSTVLLLDINDVRCTLYTVQCTRIHERRACQMK